LSVKTLSTQSTITHVKLIFTTYYLLDADAHNVVHQGLTTANVHTVLSQVVDGTKHNLHNPRTFMIHEDTFPFEV